jgi:hypothetical protein
VNDSYVTSNDDWKTMSVLSNDTSPLPLFDIEITGQPAHADEIEIRSNWRIRYYIDDDFEGTDQFTYRICDVGGNCDSATVTLTVVDD